MGIAQALRANGEAPAEAASDRSASALADSDSLSSQASDADVLKAKSLDVQSQASNASSSVFSLGGLLGGMRLGSGSASQASDVPKAAAAVMAARSAARCVTCSHEYVSLTDRVSCVAFPKHNCLIEACN